MTSTQALQTWCDSIHVAFPCLTYEQSAPGQSWVCRIEKLPISKWWDRLQGLTIMAFTKQECKRLMSGEILTRLQPLDQWSLRPSGLPLLPVNWYKISTDLKEQKCMYPIVAIDVEWDPKQEKCIYPIVAIDVEWDPCEPFDPQSNDPKSQKRHPKPVLIQVAYGNLQNIEEEPHVALFTNVSHFQSFVSDVKHFVFFYGANDLKCLQLDKKKCIDIADKLDFHVFAPSPGLQTVTEYYLYHTLGKESTKKPIATSFRRGQVLSLAQVEYAARDVIATWKLYQVLE